MSQEWVGRAIIVIGLFIVVSYVWPFTGNPWVLPIGLLVTFTGVVIPKSTP